ncbi:hypothetical protein BDW69DRAFT_188855 [Aspergillus filifer]
MSHRAAAAPDHPHRMFDSGHSALVLSIIDPSENISGGSPLNRIDLPLTTPSSTQPAGSIPPRDDTDEGYESDGSSSSFVTLDPDSYSTTELYEASRQYDQCEATREYLGKLVHGPATAPKVILDIGTGSGYWALELASAFKAATVYGVDIVLLQPTWTAPNCHFHVADITQPDWHEARSYQNADLVRIDRFFGDIPVLRWILKGAYSCCASRGVVEIHHTGICLANRNENTAFHGFYRDLETAYGRDLNPIHAYYRAMRDNGFRQVNNERREIPLDAPRNPKQEEIYQNWLRGLEAMSLRYFVERLDKSYLQATVEIAGARSALQQGQVRGSLMIEIVYGVKSNETLGPGLLGVAAASGDAHAIRQLLSAEYDVNTRDESGQTLLHLAARYGHHEVATLLMQRNFNDKAVDRKGWTALDWAVMENWPDVVRALLPENHIWRGTIKGSTLYAFALKKAYFETAIILYDAQLAPDR